MNNCKKDPIEEFYAQCRALPISKRDARMYKKLAHVYITEYVRLSEEDKFTYMECVIRNIPFKKEKAPRSMSD